MNEPPDLMDPGGTVPPAINFVTIPTTNVVSTESGMETDGSYTQRSGRKRSHLHKICKNCNKKKRKHSQAIDGKMGCRCSTGIGSTDSETNVVTNTSQENDLLASIPTPSNGPGLQVYTPVARSIYQSNDSAPFVVHVQKETNSPDDGSTLHPVSFGKFLKRNAFKNIVNGSVKRIGRNRISLAFTDFNDANSFLASNSLASNKFKAFIPSFNVTRMGVVRGVPSEWSPEEVMENISVPDGCGKILKVRRINFKTIVDGSPIWKPTQTIVITFDGQVLPKRIFICYNSLPVDLYTYPTIQCFKCCRFGHTKMQCRAQPRCYKCGNDHSGDTCDGDEDNASCCLCSGSHYAISKTCPEFNRQKNIKIAMSEKCISYGEAAKLLPPVVKSYADIVNSVPHTQTAHPSSYITNNTPKTPFTSYRKTVFNNRRTAPKLTKGFDQVAHNKIINEYNNMPSPQNGCALNTKNYDPSMMSTTDIIQILVETLTQSKLNIPTNVAPIIEMFNVHKAIKNGSLQSSGTAEVVPKKVK